MIEVQEWTSSTAVLFPAEDQFFKNVHRKVATENSNGNMECLIFGTIEY